MKMKHKWFDTVIRYVLMGLIAGFASTGCDDLEDKDAAPGQSGTGIEDYGTAEMYILSEGLFNLNNSSLGRYVFGSGQLTYDYFRNCNRRGLGDTANDMEIYDGKLYVVVNVSSVIEIIDLQTGQSRPPVVAGRRKRKFPPAACHRLLRRPCLCLFVRRNGHPHSYRLTGD